MAPAGWLSPGYRPIAPLVHIAAVGVFLDWPNHLGATMLRRALDLRRLRLVAALGITLRLVTTLALALDGKGAYAIIIGNNVVTAIPFGVDLLLVRRWRPKPGWWRVPVWHAYAAERRFGLQRAGFSVLAAIDFIYAPCSPGFESVRHQDGVKEQRLSARTRWMERS